MRKEIVELDKWEGHIILYCKGWYSTKTDLFEGLRNIWAVRCGVTEFEKEVYPNIANAMFKILRKCAPERMEYFHELLHKGLTTNWDKPNNLSPIEIVVWEYRSMLDNLAIRDDEGNLLVKLPKPQKQLMKRIVRGNGRYDDYKKVL